MKFTIWKKPKNTKTELKKIKNNKPFKMIIEDSFSITGQGTFVTGKIESGEVNVGEEVEIVGFNKKFKTTIKGIEQFQKIIDQAKKGDDVALQLRGINHRDIKPGMIIYSAGSMTPIQAEKLSKEYIDLYFNKKK